MLFAALAAFAVSAALGPLATVCFCFDDGVAITAGCCCAPQPGAPQSDAPQSGAPDGAPADDETCAPAFACDDACGCVDLSGSDDAAVERRADPLPEAALPAPAPAHDWFAIGVTSAAQARLRAPPDAPHPPPCRTVLRC